MHTPPSVSSPSPDDDNACVEVAEEAIGAVVVRYGRRLMTARRHGDQQRLEEVTAQMQECGRDRERLSDAGADEIARITRLYTERLKALEAEED